MKFNTPLQYYCLKLFLHNTDVNGTCALSTTSLMSQNLHNVSRPSSEAAQIRPKPQITCLHYYLCLVPHCPQEISLTYSRFNKCRCLRIVLSTLNMAVVTFSKIMYRVGKANLKEDICIVFFSCKLMKWFPECIFCSDISQRHRRTR